MTWNWPIFWTAFIYSVAGALFATLVALRSINRFIDKSGQFAVEPRLATAESFSDGLALVRENAGELEAARKGELPVLVEFGHDFQAAREHAEELAVERGLEMVPSFHDDLVRGVATYLNTYLIQLVGTRVLEAIRLDFFRKLQVLPLSFFQKSSTGDLLSRGLADANQLQVTLTTVANEIVRSPASLLASEGAAR